MNRSRKARRRLNGEGSVYLTANGKWRGAVSYVDAAGTSRRKFVSGATAEIVRERIGALRAGIDRGAIPNAGAETVAAFLPRWLDADRARVRPSTWRVREQHVRLYLVPALGRIAIAKLTPTDVERMQTRLLERGLSAQSVRHVRATLRRAFADAVRDRLTDRNAAALARPPRLPHRPVEYLVPADVRRLLDHVADDEVLGSVVPLAVSSGLRIGELLGLTWFDVDLKAGTLTVRRTMARTLDNGFELAETKTGRSRRTIVLPRMAIEALGRRRERQAAERVAAGPDWHDRAGMIFTDAIGRPLSPSEVSRRFRREADAIGLRITFHGLRHTAATLALAAGVPITSVSDMLGHSGIAITYAHYAAVTPELRRDTAEAIDRALGS